MPSPQVQNDSIVAVNPYLYKQGLLISNDVTTPNTVLDIAGGACRDSNNVIDMGVGALNLPQEGQIPGVASPLLLNAAVNGANGLDAGSLAASTMYAVYLIGDSRYYKPVASILTLASNSNPLLPLGYDSLRLIGYWATDGSSHFLKGYYSPYQGRTFRYDAPQATAITAGASTTYAAVDLSALVPPVNNVLANIQYNLNANAAADTLKLQGANATGDAVTVIAQVAGATAHIEGYADVNAQLVSALPKINYKVSSGSDAVALNVAGYTLTI